MEPYLETLNTAQREAVETLDGPVMIIAGAGSGKTRVLTYRIAHLMRRGVDAFNILALTFTNKAAREMKARISTIVGESDAKNLWMGTFHSVFARILREEGHRLGYPRMFTIYDTQDSQHLINGIIKEMNLDKDVYKYKQVYSRISSFKNDLITVKVYNDTPELIEADAMARRPRMGVIYKTYVERCFRAGAMDFDDLLLRTNELLSSFPEVLMKYQDQFRYIMVDEYQDTNHSQYLIVRALADRFRNICVVGDDSQSIYAFRGANINNILHFDRHFSGVSTFRLEQNYRSTKNIVLAANSVIENNKNRLDKKVWTNNDDGNRVKIHRSITDSEEGHFVAASIFENKMQHRLPESDFAVLYRTNAQSRAIEDALRKRDIPYRVYGGLSFYQRKEIKDVLAYLRLIVNPNDEEALMRIINYPVRGIGATTVNRLIVAADGNNCSIFELLEDIDRVNIQLNATTKTKLKDFMTMIKSFKVVNERKDAFELTNHVIKSTGLLREFRKDGTPEGVVRVQNIEELLNGIKNFVDEQKDQSKDGDLMTFLEDVTLATDADKTTYDSHVSLMTIHLAKGLEFPYVYVVGMEEGLFPSAMSLNARKDIEEERRLFYVALTRAEKQVHLTYSDNRYRWGKLADTEPSRFLSEIGSEFVEYLSAPPGGVINRNRSGTPDKSKLRQVKPKNSTPTKSPSPQSLQRLRKIKPNYDRPVSGSGSLNLDLKPGDRVSHDRFGLGNVMALEGKGNDSRIEIAFDNSGNKNLILRFAKLNLITPS